MLLLLAIIADTLNPFPHLCERCHCERLRHLALVHQLLQHLVQRQRQLRVGVQLRCHDATGCC